MKLSWLFHPFPLLWYDSIITRYILDRLISPIVVGTNVRSKSTSTTGAEKRTREEVDPLLSFQSLPPPQIFSTAKRSRESFPLYEIIHRGGKNKKKRNDLTSYWYLSIDVHFNSIIISNIEYFRVQRDEFGWIFTWIFSLSKKSFCPLIIISIYPISRNYKIPFRFALFERKSFLTILRNF